LATIEEDYERPLAEIYESFPEPTRASLDEDISTIWKYFIYWSIFVILSIISIISFINYGMLDETMGSRVQRAGSIIPILAMLSEYLFVIKLNKLASVIHPAQLTYEIYKARRFKPHLKLSVWLTIFFVCLGGVLSGYGDIIYVYLFL